MTQKKLARLKSVINWLFNLGPDEKKIDCAAEKFRNSMRVTAKCRYRTAVRLQTHSQFAFFTITFLSLGLIFIPLIQTADIELAFHPKVLNMMQIFLAVAVLVYSIFIGTSRFETRVKVLFECADKLKELIRTITKDIEDNKSTKKPFDKDKLEEYYQKYSTILAGKENHHPSDYVLATLEMKKDYLYTGLSRPWKRIRASITNVRAYTLPVTLIITQLIFISDMLKVTEILVPYLSTEELYKTNLSYFSEVNFFNKPIDSEPCVIPLKCN